MEDISKKDLKKMTLEDERILMNKWDKVEKKKRMATESDLFWRI